MKIYLVMDCGKCEEPIRIGLITLQEYNGIPEIYYDAAAQTRFDCDNCGTANYTGDFEAFTEDEL